MDADQRLRIQADAIADQLQAVLADHAAKCDQKPCPAIGFLAAKCGVRGIVDWLVVQEYAQQYRSHWGQEDG